MLDPGRFRVPRPLTGAVILLLDDTWTSGGTAQSAAVTLKRAGARSVAVVVLGRHLLAVPAPGARPLASGPWHGPAGRPPVNRLDW
jgi:orotate phosphoribosyltransferase